MGSLLLPFTANYVADSVQARRGRCHNIHSLAWHFVRHLCGTGFRILS